ncbi:MAG: uroporphyrinogen decarboxylase family protein [Candidatus Coatesbacteria bacterium]
MAAILGRPHDRIPVTTGYLYEWVDDWKAAEPSYRSLVDYCRLHADVFQPWAPRALNERLFMTSSDRMAVEWKRWEEKGEKFLEARVKAPGGELRQVSKTIPGVATTWTVEHFLKTDRDVETFLSIPYEPVAYDASGWTAELAKIGDRGVLMPGLADPMCRAAELFEFGEFTVRAATEPETFRRILDFFARGVGDYLRAALESGVQGVFRVVGAEYATPPYLKPVQFREYVLDYDAPLIERIHRAGSLARVHCHGRVRDVLPMMVEMGADLTDPVEPPPSGDVTLDEAYEITGGRLAMCGNIEIREIETMSIPELDARIRDACETGKRRGRFLLAPSAEPITIPLTPDLEARYRAYLDSGLRWGST